MKDEEGKPVFIQAEEVNSYFTEEFWEAYEFFATTEILEVPPFSGGWTTWPDLARQTLVLFKAERNKVDTEESEARTKGA